MASLGLLACFVLFGVGLQSADAQSDLKTTATSATSDTSAYPDLPAELTSFGAAVLDGAVYVYGGHQGDAHSYYQDAQFNKLIRLNLDSPKAWETLAEGPHLQGLALVPAGGKLVRLGGFTAKNKKEEDASLWSQDSVAAWSPKQKAWQELPALPEPRSSFDAAAIGDEVYVIGGWQLRGDEDSVWHKTAWKLKVAVDTPKWEALPEAPFQRRALAVAAFADKLYAIGGMTPDGPSTAVHVFDPQSGKWSEGPALPGKPLEGFGCSAFAVGKGLYVSTHDGNLLKLSADGKSWETHQELDNGRFFHRMLPYQETGVLMIGGANRSLGKFQDIERVELK